MKVQNIKSMIHNLCVDYTPHKDARGVRQLPVGFSTGWACINIRRYFYTIGYDI